MTAERSRSVYDGARTEELEEPLLPRWFVLLAVASIPIALGVAVWAFVVFGPEEVPFAERRPPGQAGQLTTDVGQYNIGETSAERLALTSCPLFRGIRASGSAQDRLQIETALAVLCEERLPESIALSVSEFGRQQGEVRFAQFQATGVDSTLDLSSDPPLILLNARFAREDTELLWIAPLIVHDTTYLQLEPGLAASELEARMREALICERLLVDLRPSRACDDADGVLALLDPIRALEAAGYR